MRGALGLALALALCGGVPSARAAPPTAEAGQTSRTGQSGQPFWSRAGGVSPGRDDGTSGLFAAAVKRTTEGRYREAAAAYGAALAAGADAPAVYANLAEVLMADGQLAGAEASYRDAIAAASSVSLPGPRLLLLDDSRGRAQDLLLAYLGLAVALDRDGQPRAASEMMRRALALDATTAVLAVAALPNTDLFFVPEGEVYYYLGLARSVAGRRSEAAEAFREFLTRTPASRWATRAEAHLTELAELALAPTPTSPISPISPSSLPESQQRPASAPRVIAIGTVLATGGAAAPLIDAAWREQQAILDDCLSAAPELAAARVPVRLAVELAIDRRGRITAAAIRLPPAVAAWGSAEKLSLCLEQAIKTGLRLPAPQAARSTRARTELLVGFPSPGQNPQRVPNLPR
jgi:tetratricopeptide (TPR) repeat protein